MTKALCAAVLAIAVPSFAAFQPLPPEPGAKPTGLTVRVVSYNGSTNGAITVEVKNPTATEQEFTAAGLFFVPAMDPDKAPQRLGAVGPYEVGTARYEKLKIAPGASVKANLDGAGSGVTPRTAFACEQSRARCGSAGRRLSICASA